MRCRKTVVWNELRDIIYSIELEPVLLIYIPINQMLIFKNFQTRLLIGLATSQSGSHVWKPLLFNMEVNTCLFHFSNRGPCVVRTNWEPLALKNDPWCICYMSAFSWCPVRVFAALLLMWAGHYVWYNIEMFSALLAHLCRALLFIFVARRRCWMNNRYVIFWQH